MSAPQIETAFLSSVIPNGDSDEPLKLQKSIAQLQHDERCVRRFAWAMAMFLMVGLAGVGYGAILQENFPYNLHHHVIYVFCVSVLASVIAWRLSRAFWRFIAGSCTGCGRNAAGWSQDSWSRVWFSER